ncbi:MAG: O-antigen ligase family protein [Thermomicrobiales bacterium]|nr:O-antigen ligase family protein [Thermomicrobiales bacterium]
MIDRVDAVFFVSISISLLGYMFLDRGFAYFGLPPIHVGELLLGLALLAVVSHAEFIPVSLPVVLLGAFMALGAVRTVPFITHYGIDAFRDGMIWGYAFFALAIVAVASTERIKELCIRYKSALSPFAVWVPMALILQQSFSNLLPSSPFSNVPILSAKPGSFGVHLSGIAAFVLAGVMVNQTSPGDKSVPRYFWPLWFVGFLFVASQTRGGFLAVAGALGVALLLFPSLRFFQAALAMIFLAVIFTAINPEVDIGRNRTVSPRQIGSNVVSIFDRSEGGRLQGTVDFRLEWWGRIVDYTFRGPYFWTGKGFGVNLSVADGVSIEEDVRAPHNSHITILARMGVPGLMLWIAFNLALAIALLKVIRSRKPGIDPWLSAVAGWLLMYWLAMMINTAFDPYLEGPQGGIWYWSVVGLSLAVIQIARTTEPAPASRRPRRHLTPRV